MIYSDAPTLSSARSGIGAILTQSPLWFAAYHRAVRFESDPYKLKYTASDQAIDVSIERPKQDALTVPLSDDYAPWKTMTFWQFSEGGDTDAGPGWDPIKLIEPGISAYDTSYFFGTRKSFGAFVTATSWKCDPNVAKKWANAAPPASLPAPAPAPRPSSPTPPSAPTADPSAPAPPSPASP